MCPIFESPLAVVLEEVGEACEDEEGVCNKLTGSDREGYCLSGVVSCESIINGLPIIFSANCSFIFNLNDNALNLSREGKQVVRLW